MSNNRFVNCAVPNLPDENICAWLTANRINPSTTPADQQILVTEENIEYLEFETTESGHLAIAYNGNDPYRPKVKRVVPLLSDPENHGVEVYRNV